MKHTIGGTFQAASKITSGLSKGMLYFTSDDDYISSRERKKITEKPKNFVEGIGYGVFSIASGVYHGITDIVAKPIEGVKKNENKLKGFGKGLLQGFAGVVVKPISGVLDMVSKTTEGIKNTVKDDIVCILDRLPRPFYGKFKLLRTYNLYHAQVIEVMNTKIKNNIDRFCFDFYSSEIYKNDSGNSVLIIFTTTTLYFIDLSAKELKVSLNYEDIKDIYLESDNKIRIVFKRAINDKLNSKITISKTHNNSKHILVKIKEAIENNHEDYSLPFES
jgi:vacuolar protein sorting-associated protein 13A/C